GGQRRDPRRLSEARHGALRLGLPGRAEPREPRLAARAGAALRLPAREDGGRGAQHPRLAQPLRALVRRARYGGPRAAQRPRPERQPCGGLHAAVRRRAGELQPAAHPVFRPDELAARQPAGARRPHDHGRLAGGARPVPRPQARRVRVLASRCAARARPHHQVDPAPGGARAPAGAHPQAPEGRLPRAGERVVPRPDARLSPRAPARLGLAHATLLRPGGARPRAGQPPRRPPEPGKASLDASQPRDLAPAIPAGLSAKLRWRLNRLRCMTPLEVAHRAARALQARAERAGLFPLKVPTPSLARPSQRWVHVTARVAPGPYLAAADRIAEGWLDIFALKGVDFGSPPRWNRDPKTGIEAPLTFGKLLDYRDPDVVGDIKYLWEPNRHLHLVTLAQAYALTRERRYADAIAEQLQSWFIACPYPLGAIWSSSLEPALRLLNWSIAWQLVGGAHGELFEK